jgi:hypothetical protein
MEAPIPPLDEKKELNPKEQRGISLPEDSKRCWSDE